VNEERIVPNDFHTLTFAKSFLEIFFIRKTFPYALDFYLGIDASFLDLTFIFIF